MLNNQAVIALRMERQQLTHKASEQEYLVLYRDMQPGQNVYWNGFGDPPSLTYRVDFNDMEYNRERQRTHALIKGRFTGGNLGWIVPEDLELFAAAFAKPLSNPTHRQLVLLELIEREGPLNIHQMKEETGLLVKEITPILHRLQEAFLIYEDQYDSEWDRGWYKFSDMFPNADLSKYSRPDAVKMLIKRFAYRHIWFDSKTVKSFYRLSEKEIKTAITSLISDGILAEADSGYLLKEDFETIMISKDSSPCKSVYAMHRNDFLVKSAEHMLKELYPHQYPDTLYYLLIDGVFRGAVVGKFRYTPEIEDIILDLSEQEALKRKAEILSAVHILCGEDNPIKRYQGEEI